MQTIILAAGRGTRMQPLSDTMPKPMLPLADRPIAARVADTAVAAGADKLVFTVGYRRDVVEEFFGAEHRGVQVEYAVQEDQVGTADAVSTAIEHVDGPFTVLNGDNVYDEGSLSKLFTQVPSVGYTRVETPEEYGVLSMEGDVVTEIVEKPDSPSSNVVNTGAYAFPESVRTRLDVPASERGEHELTDVLQRVINDYTVTGIEFETWADIGHPWELLEVTEHTLATQERRIEGDVHADATLRGAVVVEHGATIDSGVVVEGPVLVHSGATIGPNAYVRGSTVVGEGASVGHAVEIKNSLLMADANVNHLSYVGDSVLGPGSNLGAGTVTPNLRHDGEPVRAGDANRLTSRRKFGAVLGPGAKTGINTSLDPGVVLSSDSWTRAGAVVTSDR